VAWPGTARPRARALLSGRIRRLPEQQAPATVACGYLRTRGHRSHTATVVPRVGEGFPYRDRVQNLVQNPSRYLALCGDVGSPVPYTVSGMRAQEATFRGLMTQDRQFRVPLYQRHYRWRTDQ